jgi:hypothetical protein
MGDIISFGIHQRKRIFGDLGLLGSGTLISGWMI